MSTRRASEIPPATDDLLAAGRRRVGEGRLNLRALRPAGMDDSETERHVDEITRSYGAHAQIPPGKAKEAAPAPAPEPREPEQPPAPEPREPEQPPAPVRRPRYASFRVDLPEYLDQELTMRSARERATKTYLIMEALHRAGYTIHPEDLVADRRKTRFHRD